MDHSGKIVKSLITLYFLTLLKSKRKLNQTVLNESTINQHSFQGRPFCIFRFTNSNVRFLFSIKTEMTYI